MFIDTHTHLNDERFLGQEEKAIIEAKNSGVEKLVIPGYDLASSKKAVELAKKYNQYALVGIHPSEASKLSKEEIDIQLLEIEKLANEEVVVGVGEIGYDFYWDKKDETYEIQNYLFEKQIQIANNILKPIAIHCREATNEMIATLTKVECKKRGILHCCPLNEELIKQGQKLGYYISFSGVITFKNAQESANRVLKHVDLNRLLIETDAPYLAPVPFRGKMNEPKYVVEVAKKLSEYFNVSTEEIGRITTLNAKKIYGIK